MKERPEYCHSNPVPDPCPLCGATVSGDDPVHGVCQARNTRPRPQSILDFVLVDRESGEIVASTPVLKG